MFVYHERLTICGREHCFKSSQTLFYQSTINIIKFGWMRLQLKASADQTSNSSAHCFLIFSFSLLCVCKNSFLCRIFFHGFCLCGRWQLVYYYCHRSHSQLYTNNNKITIFNEPNGVVRKLYQFGCTAANPLSLSRLKFKFSILMCMNEVISASLCGMNGSGTLFR